MSLYFVESLTKTFKTSNGSFNALDNISLELPNKGLISITGKSGSGKSTFLNIVAGIEKPTKGKVRYFKKDISHLSDRKFSKYHLYEVAFVFQHYNLFNDFTALENVILPLSMKGVSKHKSIKIANELFDKFNLQYLKKQKVKHLSGGEKQRVAILRSLAIKPKVILCDEPTGALDYKNGIMIMEIFKEISKSSLVLMVSHNLEFVKSFSDRVITFKDGKIDSDETLFHIDDEINNEKCRRKYRSNWTNIFINLNLKRDIKKNILSLLSCSIGFASIFIAFGFSEGSTESQKIALSNNLSMTYSTVSEITYYKIENSPLSYQKEVRPSSILIDSKTEDFNSLVTADNLSSIFCSFPTGRYLNKEINGFEMVPIYDISLKSFGSNLLYEGEVPNGEINEVLVNQEFVNLLQISDQDAVDELFIITSSSTVSYQTGDINNPIIKDTYSYNIKLRISGVIKEFSFLNTPKIYYSYQAVKNEIGMSFAENISKYLGKSTSFLSLIENANNDDVLSSYSSILFLTSLDEKEKYFELIKKLKDEKDSMQITSTAYEIQQSYSTFVDSFSSALYVFVIIAFIGINMILGMISLSTFIQNKKESAIMTCLGGRTKNIISIYLVENYLVMMFSLFISVGIGMLLEKFLNQFIENKFTLSNLIAIPFNEYFGFRFGLIILLFFVALICSTLFTLTPLLIYRKVSLADELRDE